MKILSPDGQLCVEAGLESQAGRKWCAYRVMLGRHVLVARSEVVAPSEPTGAAETRDLVGHGSVVLARELTIRYPRGRCVFRIADDAIAVFPVGRGIEAVPRLASTLSCGYASSATTDGGVGYERLTPAKCRKLVQNFCGLLFYSTGKCAAIVASGEARGFIMTAADRPVSAVIPRGLRHLMRGLTDHLPLTTSHLPLTTDHLPLTTDHLPLTTCSIAAFFLNFGYIFDAVRVSQPKAVIRDGTSAHAEAFSILADPARGEAAAGFRGEWGEYVCGARRSGRIWHVAGITEKLRVVTLFFPYLEEGVRYRATWTLDDGAVLPTNAVNPTPSVISSGDKAIVRMNENGGFVLRLEPMD